MSGEEEEIVEQMDEKPNKAKKSKKEKKTKEKKPKEKKSKEKKPAKLKKERTIKTETDKINKKFGDFIDNVLNLDRTKATKYIIVGFIIAVVFGSIALTSVSIANNTNVNAWTALQNQQNDMNYWNGVYGLQEHTERTEQITLMDSWMRFQVVIFANLARIGVNFGLVFVLIGFIGYTADEEMDETMRRISLLLAGIVVTVIMFTSLFTNITVSIA